MNLQKQIFASNEKRKQFQFQFSGDFSISIHWKWLRSQKQKIIELNCIEFQSESEEESSKKFLKKVSKIRWLLEKVTKSRMIQLKCADLLLLIGAVMCGVASNNVDYFDRNNKPFLVNRDDDIIGSHERRFDDDRFMFTTMRC
jgi:hypothetical protein